LFTIGIGPSSSHTVGPMRAARLFASEAVPHRPAGISVELHGSLAHTGKGHGTHLALVSGLIGKSPESVDPDFLLPAWERACREKQLQISGDLLIAFDPSKDIRFNRKTSLPFHPNGMTFRANGVDGSILAERTLYSTGGGFISDGSPEPMDESVPYPYGTAADLVEQATALGISLSEFVLLNEDAKRPRGETMSFLDRIWKEMRMCIDNGLQADGVLPGGLKVARRAPRIYRSLLEKPESAHRDSLRILDYVNVYAIAVNEENAAGRRVVTAPTNGAAGIIPSVMRYTEQFLSPKTGWQRNFLLTAGAIGMLFKENASISGADVGCQGEVGVACSMAAGALAEQMGGSPDQVENAAEIGMEHNLGLTCDPVGGLVQIPCIERNAMGAVKAINAARIALRGDGRHTVSLDAVIRTMRDTGKDMRRKYKETSKGGLAVNVVEC